MGLLHAEVPSLSLEVGPLETAAYRPLVQAGADGLVVYQETYDREVYAALHTAGPKRDFAWRMETPERAYAAGFRRLGLGALYGLGDWRLEAISVAAHAAYLLRQLLEGATDDFAAAAAAVRGRVPAAHPSERPRSGAVGLRLSPDVP